MSLIGAHPFAVVLCKCSDLPSAPQPAAFFEAFFTNQDVRQWSDAFGIEPASNVAAPGGHVAAVARSPQQLDVFWIGADGAVWTDWWDGAKPDGTWVAHAPFAITGTGAALPGAPVAAVSRAPDHIDLFWVGTDGAVWTHWWDGSAADGAWNAHSAFPLTAPNALPAGGGVAAVSQHLGHLDVFWASTDGAIWSAWWDAAQPDGAWDKHTIFPITGPGQAVPGGGVAAVSQFGGHLDVFWAGPDSAVWTQWWDRTHAGGLWNEHSAFSITSPGVAAPGGNIGAVAQYAGHLDVFWAAPDGTVWTQWWDASDPSGPWASHAAAPITARKAASPGADVVAVSREAGQLDVFWADTTGAVASTSWNANINSAQWNPPFELTPVNAIAQGGGVAAVARDSAHLDVFFVNTSNGVSSVFWPAPSRWSLANYWRDMSYGQLVLDETRIFDWVTMSQTTAAFQALSRGAQLAACVTAATAQYPAVAGYQNVVGIVNGPANSGATGSGVVLGTGSWTSTLAEHETGHAFGLDHSFDDTPNSYDPNNDGRAGAYGDGWDIMSAQVFGKRSAVVVEAFGPAGPGLNAPNRDGFGWISGDRLLTLPPGTHYHSSVTLAGLSHPTAGGYLMVKLLVDPADTTRYYTLELRLAEEWDAGISTTVLVHYVENGITYLITGDGGPERTAGSTYSIHQAAQNLPPRHTGVASVAQRPGHLDVFWAGSDGAIWTQWWDGTERNGGWDRHGAFAVTGMQLAPPGAGVSAVTQHAGHLDVFWAGNDGAIWTQWWDETDPSGPWDKHPAFPVTARDVAPPGAAVAAVSRFSGHLDLFWVGNDGAVWTQWWDRNDPKGNWVQHNAFPITPGRTAPPGGGIAAVAQSEDHLDVFWSDSQGAIATTWWDANDPDGWRSHAALRITLRKRIPAGAPIAAVSQFNGHLDVFWIGTDGATWTTYWDAAAPTGPWWDPTQNANPLHGPEKSVPIGTAGSSPPGAGIAAVTQSSGHLDVFWAATDGAVWTNWWDAALPNGGWANHAAFEIAPAGTTPAGGSITATVQRPGHLDVFWADVAGAIGSDWWDSALPTGPWDQHAAFRTTGSDIVPPGAPMNATERYVDEQFTLAVQAIDAATAAATIDLTFN